MSAMLLMVALTAAPAGTATQSFCIPLQATRAAGEVEADAPGAVKRLDAAKAVVSVTNLAIAGRVGATGLWVDIEATVRSHSSEPMTVDVLRLNEATVIDSLPQGGDVFAQVRDGVLSLTAVKETTSKVTLKLMVGAKRDGRRSTARFEILADLPPVPLRLDADDRLFDLPGAAVVREWGGYAVLPVRHVYQVSWVSKQEAAVKPQAATQRMPVDPQVKEASSHWVTTLEGRATHEVKLSLQVDRPGVLDVHVPKGQKLVRAKVNGAPIATEAKGDVLPLDVGPSALGATEGTVDLLFAQDLGVFHLSGVLQLESPQLSWPVARWNAQTVLPKVFTYVRTGGSMEQVGGENEAHGDVPGKALLFSQHLISSSAPMVTLGYSVDLKDSYFR